MPRPGDFGLVAVKGVPGALVKLGQWFLVGADDYAHCFVVVDGALAVEAWHPGGARLVPLARYPRAVYSSVPLTDAQRETIAGEARSLVGTPYSVGTIALLILRRLRLPLAHVLRYVRHSRSLICSQLVDECYTRAGIDLFPSRAGLARICTTPHDLSTVLRGAA